MPKGYGTKIFLYVILISVLAMLPIVSAELICDVVSSCAYSDILHMSATANAHAEQANETVYNNKICCYETQGITIGSSCLGVNYNYLNLSSSTNAHVEKNTESNYAYGACISASSGNLSCTYASSCYGYDTCLASISSTESGNDTNLHIADCDTSPYTTKICCTTSGGVIENYMTFEMEFNISGNANDQAYVDSYGTGYYSELDKKYTCIQDTTLTNQPAFGIVFGGRVLNYINLTTGNSYKMKLSQYERGNRFILPTTINNCNAMSRKTPVTDIVQPFVGFLEKISTIELSLAYPTVDIAGDYQKSGAISLIIEKNETNERQILITPVI